MKPKIYKFRNEWRCVRSGVLGRGDSPNSAYRALEENELKKLKLKSLAR